MFSPWITDEKVVYQRQGEEEGDSNEHWIEFGKVDIDDRNHFVDLFVFPAPLEI